MGDGSAFTLWLPAPDGAAPSRTQASAVPRAPAASAAAPSVRGAGIVGVALASGIASVSVAFVERLRHELLVPQALALTHGQLADHTATLLTEFAEALVALAESPDAPSPLLAGGTAIQRLVAELHGTQRAHLGWTDAALACEYVILRETVLTTIRPREIALVEDPAMRAGVALLTRFFEQAEAVSRLTLARAGEVSRI